MLYAPFIFEDSQAMLNVHLYIDREGKRSAEPEHFWLSLQDIDGAGDTRPSSELGIIN